MSDDPDDIPEEEDHSVVEEESVEPHVSEEDDDAPS
jgi:hypothetical protein